MGFLNISGSALKMGAGRAVLSILDEKKQKKAAEDAFVAEKNRMKETADYQETKAIAGEQRAANRQKQADTDAVTRVEAMNKTLADTGQVAYYLGNGNITLKPVDVAKKLTIEEQMEKATSLTAQYRKLGQIPSDAFFTPDGGGKDSYSIKYPPKKPAAEKPTAPTFDTFTANVEGKGGRVFASATAGNEVTGNLVKHFTWETPEGPKKTGVVIYADPKMAEKKDVPMSNASLLMNTMLDTNMKYHVDAHRAGLEDGGGGKGLLFAFENMIKLNSSSITDSLKTGERLEGGLIQIANPTMRLGLEAYAQKGLEEQENAKYIINNILAPALSIQSKELIKALNLVDETPVYTANDSNLFIDTSFTEKLEQAGLVDVDANGNKSVKASFKSSAQDIASSSGIPYTEVIGGAVNSGDPEKHLENIKTLSGPLSQTVQRSGTKAIQTEDLIYKNKLLEVTMGLTARGGILAIRAMLPKRKAPPVTSMAMGEDGAGITAQFQIENARQGLDAQGALSRATAAGKARKTIATLRELQKNGVRGDFIEGIELKIQGGIEAVAQISGLADSLKKQLSETPIAGVPGSEEYERNLMARQETLADINSVNSSLSGGNLEVKALYRMLSMQLGYYMAGAVQGGGSSGRNISDFDVRNQMNAMGLDTLIGIEQKAANLDYLAIEMEQSEAIYRSYAESADDFSSWRATQIYDNLVSGTHADLTTLRKVINNYDSTSVSDSGSNIPDRENVLVPGQTPTAPTGDPFGRGSQVSPSLPF